MVWALIELIIYIEINFFVINTICDIICDTITGSRYRDMQKNTHLPIILHLKIRVG